MNAHVLVADDNSANLDLMLYILRAFGYDAVGVTDGVAALAAAQNDDFDLILTDVLMPGIDGYELARRIKSDPRLKGVPLVAVTALAMQGDEQRVVDAGFNGYITKPIEPQNFISKLTAFLERRAD